MNIALDFDNTITADPELFLWFAGIAIQRGHTVYCVSYRWNANPPVLPKIRIGDVEHVIPVHCTEWKAKRKHMAELGIKIDVWVDDTPESAHFDHVQVEALAKR